MMTMTSCILHRSETGIAVDGFGWGSPRHGTGAALAGDSVSVLMKQPLADMAGKVATVLTVDYAPGAASDPHVHPGSVFAYVLEGTVVTQLEGEQPIDVCQRSELV